MQISVVNLVNDKIIFNVVLQISAVCVVDDEIIFNAVLEISVVSVVNDEIIFNVALQISGIENRIVSELSDKTIFHVVLNVIVVSIVMKLFFMWISVVRVVPMECILSEILRNSVVRVVNNESEPQKWI